MFDTEIISAYWLAGGPTGQCHGDIPSMGVGSELGDDPAGHCGP